jgi:hypothetical protein
MFMKITKHQLSIDTTHLRVILSSSWLFDYKKNILVSSENNKVSTFKEQGPFKDHKKKTI